jgi:dipeptidase E
MKLLLTSGGVSNGSIRQALVELLGQPIEGSRALFIPTAAWAHPRVGPGAPWQQITGYHMSPICELGWKSLGPLELTALPTLPEERWVPVVEGADVILVSGGDAVYLRYWMRESGVADLIPSLSDTVWVGVSAGSLVMTPRIGDDFVNWEPPTGPTDTTLGVVDFAIFPHVDNEMMPGNSMAEAERWAAGIGLPSYALDDQSAIRVVGGAVDVISEGHWKYFAP